MAPKWRKKGVNGAENGAEVAEHGPKGEENGVKEAENGAKEVANGFKGAENGVTGGNMTSKRGKWRNEATTNSAKDAEYGVKKSKMA